MIARIFILAAAVALTAQASAQQQTGFNRPTTETARPNAQLVRSVQYKLDVLQFGHVDARRLTNRQIAALHLELTDQPVVFGRGFIRTRQKIEVILGWDAPLPLPE